MSRGDSTPIRIIFLADGRPYVATEPTESTMCRLVKGEPVHEPSVMVSSVIRPATREELNAWRDGK